MNDTSSLSIETNKKFQVTLLLLRLSLGWFMFYAGITKILNPSWTAEGFLSNSKVFHDFYLWFASPGMLPIINFLNEWGITLIGVSLLTGALVKWSSPFGAFLMIIYYFPHGFPHPTQHTYIVDEHIIYALLFAALFIVDAGHYFGFDGWWKSYKDKKVMPATQAK